MNNGQFPKGHTPWNKGKKGYMGANKTSFVNGHLPHNTHPVGTVVRWDRKKKNGAREVAYVINIDWRGNRKAHNNYRWYLWEVANQQDRPEGCVLYLRDGDPDNMTIDNFELITRAELIRRNRREA